MKKLLLVTSLTALFTLSAAGQAAADYGGRCPYKHKSGYGSHSGKESGCPITAKLMKKARFLLKHQTDLGLNENQVQAIKAVKMDAKKAGIRQMAEMAIFKIDVESKLSETTVDMAGINAMIDTASAEMAAAAKETVASYARLKAVLTADQMAKAKTLWM